MTPTIQTARLTLRAHTLDDFDEYAEMWADPRVTQHIGGKPFTREECWGRFLRFPGHWSLMGFGCWIARERESGRFVGDLGLFDMHRELQPSFGGAPEAGWALAPWCHGRGYATEAMQAALGWVDANVSPPRTVCMINPGNEVSIRVAGKLGYREYARTSYKTEAVILFERAAP